MTTIVCERGGLGKKILTSILKPTVLCGSMNQAANYRFSVPHHPNYFIPRLGGMDTPLPLGLLCAGLGGTGYKAL